MPLNHSTYNPYQSLAFSSFFLLQEGKTCIKSMNILTIIHILIKYCYVGEVSYIAELHTLNIHLSITYFA